MKRLLSFAIIVSLFAVCFSACSKKEAGNATPPPDSSDGLTVKDGQYLADACGNKIVLRGVNLGSVYAAGFGSKELTEIVQTGANAVRLTLSTTYQDWTNGGVVKPMKATEIEPLIKTCINNKMIPILELHDYTGSANPGSDIAKAANWWTGNDIGALLKKYQASIIINIANEPDNGSETKDALYNAYVAAITSIRNAGITCPLMIDAYNWAKDPQFIIDKGSALMDKDPLHSLIFSIHAYWPTHGLYGNYSDAQITTYMNNLKNTNLPVVIGELAKADVQDQNYAINYTLIMKLCQQNGFGYLCWWWGFYNNPGANNVLSMTATGLYTGLSGEGKIVVVTDANSIQKTSVKPCQL